MSRSSTTSRWNSVSSIAPRRCWALRTHCRPHSDRTSGPDNPGRAPHLALRGADGQASSTLDLFQHGWVLLTQDDAWTDATKRIDVAFVRIDASEVLGPKPFHEAYGVGPRGASLVRPDGYIAARWTGMPADPAAELTEALRQVAA
jgi:putative polyketide hydroxylase